LMLMLLRRNPVITDALVVQRSCFSRPMLHLVQLLAQTRILSDPSFDTGADLGRQ
jgi:hypothetical protein